MPTARAGPNEPPSAFALLTPPGRGGIAVIRCVGPAAESAIRTCFRPVARSDRLPPVGSLAYGRFLDADGRPIDEIILHRAGPAAFEVNCHGGPIAVQAVSCRLEALGLSKVDPTRLAAIEGIRRLERDARRSLREARTPLAARILIDQLNGALAQAVRRIVSDLGTGRLDEARSGVETLLARWRGCGRFLASPPRIAIAGRPNAGKSTLLNWLVGSDRAITAETPGTTRDYVEAEAALDGVPVTLIDTAGLRETGETVERLGVERAQREISRADVVIYLVDAVEGFRPDDQAALAAIGERALPIWNKSDLKKTCPERSRGGGEPPLPSISALMGDGAAALVASLLAHLGYRPTAPGDAVPFTADHAAAIDLAGRALAAARRDEARRALDALL